MAFDLKNVIYFNTIDNLALMRSVHYSQYGGPEVFSVIEKPKPEPTDEEILVKVMCTTVNRTDTGMTSAMYFVSRIITGLFSPKKQTPGTDFSGVITKVGKKIKRFKVGDEVFGFDDNILSSQAEYMVINPSKNVRLKPENVSHKQAAASIEGAHYAMNGFKTVHTKSGDDVLIYGATGAIGSAAVQLAKQMNAHVDAVANTPNLELVQQLGAAKVYDYLTEDYTKSSKKYDLIFDAVGKSSFKACKRLLKPKGKYISTELGKNGINIWLALTNKHVKFPFPKDIDNSLEVISDLLQRGLFHPVIDREYPLEQVQKAYEFVTAGKKTGNVILQISK